MISLATAVYFTAIAFFSTSDASWDCSANPAPCVNFGAWTCTDSAATCYFIFTAANPSTTGVFTLTCSTPLNQPCYVECRGPNACPGTIVISVAGRNEITYVNCTEPAACTNKIRLGPTLPTEGLGMSLDFNLSQGANRNISGTTLTCPAGGGACFADCGENCAADCTAQTCLGSNPTTINCGGGVEDCTCAGDIALCTTVTINTQGPTTAPVAPPTRHPSQSPTTAPSSLPSLVPSWAPSTSPTTVPSQTPSVQPTSMPTNVPSLTPSSMPTGVPSNAPTNLPSSVPSGIPTVLPTFAPSSSPSSIPSGIPSTLPSSAPSTSPSLMPSQSPSSIPSSVPSGSPTMVPSFIPSLMPTNYPSTSPSSVPSNVPSVEPTSMPSSSPSSVPSNTPTSMPSGLPSASPSSMPSSIPSNVPTIIPTQSPSGMPSSIPSAVPSLWPSQMPSSSPSSVPSNTPTHLPSSVPSSSPTHSPTSPPSGVPSSAPSHLPSAAPTQVPSSVPSVSPSQNPSSVPTNLPSHLPTAGPSSMPSSIPSGIPTHLPTESPSLVPSQSPTASPSGVPSASPSSVPSATPSEIPTHLPTFSPTHLPSSIPSMSPSGIPSNVPTLQPTINPSSAPTDVPSDAPSDSPSSAPSGLPTHIPTFLPSHTPTFVPSVEPSFVPSALPSGAPTMIPTNVPSNVPTVPPTLPPLTAAPPTPCPLNVRGYHAFVTEGSPFITVHPKCQAVRSLMMSLEFVEELDAQNTPITTNPFLLNRGGTWSEQLNATFTDYGGNVFSADRFIYTVEILVNSEPVRFRLTYELFNGNVTSRLLVPCPNCTAVQIPAETFKWSLASSNYPFANAANRLEVLIRMRGAQGTNVSVYQTPIPAGVFVQLGTLAEFTMPVQYRKTATSSGNLTVTAADSSNLNEVELKLRFDSFGVGETLIYDPFTTLLPIPADTAITSPITSGCGTILGIFCRDTEIAVITCLALAVLLAIVLTCWCTQKNRNNPPKEAMASLTAVETLESPTVGSPGGDDDDGAEVELEALNKPEGKLRGRIASDSGDTPRDQTEDDDGRRLSSKADAPLVLNDHNSQAAGMDGQVGDDEEKDAVGSIAAESAEDRERRTEALKRSKEASFRNEVIREHRAVSNALYRGGGGAGGGKVEIIKQGWLMKWDEEQGRFDRKYFILHSNMQMNMYGNNQADSIQGVTDLSSLTTTKRNGQEVSAMTFETTHRFKADTIEVAAAWEDALDSLLKQEVYDGVQ